MASRPKNSKQESAPIEPIIARDMAKLSRIGSSSSDEELLFEELLAPVEGAGTPIGAGMGTGTGLGEGSGCGVPKGTGTGTGKGLGEGRGTGMGIGLGTGTGV